MLHTDAADFEGTASKEDEEGSPASRLIDGRIAELADWRGQVLSRIRSVVRGADPRVEEDWKWRGVPVWTCNGIICTGETYRSIVKMTFAHGASLDDPAGLFNASLDGGTRRAIDIREGEEIDHDALAALIRSAIALNDAKVAAR
ncbi:DUF1801 domain-containing protein [Agrobacterium larrymoorei]|uniref:DUF1801 domain-containing protein n=1 Tax=Agrobacterium larrymoorei TaxID=160699 RepID=UPI0030C25E0C